MSKSSINLKIWEVEKKFNLINKKINDIYFWRLIRSRLARKIKRKKKISGQAHTKHDTDFFSRIFYLPKLLKNTHLHGAIKKRTQRDILIFPCARKEKTDDEYIDKFTKYFVENLKHENYEIIDRAYKRRHHFIKPNSKRSYNEHFSFFDFLKMNFIQIKLKEEEKKFLKSVNKEIRRSLDVEIDLIELVKREISEFKTEYDYYEKLIQKRSPKKIYLVVSYKKGMPSLIAAAKDNGVKTIEFQHGTMNKYHLGYSFPHNDKVPYFPDKLLLFGKYWADSTPLPEHVEIEYYGFPYMENKIEQYRHLQNKKNQVIFISQGTIGGELSKIAQELADQKEELEIVYKLHPGEYDRWQKEYPWLMDAEELEKFRVIDSNDVELYELLARSEYQVGVSSTAIFEGIVLDCKTIIMDLPGGKEYMEYLIGEGYAKLAGDTGDIMGYIEEGDFPTDVDKNYFFEGVGDKR